MSSSIRVFACVAALAVAGSLLAVSGASAASGSSVYTWGSNGFGQLGDGSADTAVRGVPGPTSLSDIVDISGGREHVLALRSNGTVAAWGSDANGAIGNGLPLSDESTPVAVPGLTGIVDIDDGHYHSLALKSDGTVWGWGQNFLGQLAQGNDASPKASPVQWGSISNAVAVYGGRDMTYVLAADGELWCSGGNGLECGRPEGAEITSPVTVPGLPDLGPGPDLVEVAGGRNHAVALAEDGTVWTWGENDYGQLGSGNRTNRAAPQQVAGLSDIVEVGAGAEHSLAVTASGEVYVWGAGSRGELGLGTQTDRLTPVHLSGLSGIVEVDAGRSHSFAIGGDGRLWAWGWNFAQQVSTSTADEVYTPVEVPGLSDVVAAGGGQAYSVALTAPVAAVLSDGFEAGLADWTVVGRLKLDDLRKSPVGTAPSVRANVTARKAGAWQSLPAALDDVCVSAWVRRDTVGTTTTLLRLRDGAGVGIAQLQVAPSGALRVRSDIDGIGAAAGATLPAGTWRQVTLCVHHDQGALDTVRVEVGGIEVGSWQWTTSTVDQVQIGSVRPTTVTMNIDDVVAY